MPAKKKYEKTVNLYVRFPDDMHARIQAIAEKDRRSLNAMVVVLVQEALDNRSLLTTPISLPLTGTEKGK